MNSDEEIRLREITARLVKLRKKHEAAYQKWSTANVIRMDLRREIEMLDEEREALEQGQLLFSNMIDSG